MPDLLNTRGGEDGARLEAAFRRVAPGRWESIPCPLIGFEVLGASVPAGTVPIFTSARGVLACEPGAGPAWCVGPRTAEVARSRGWEAQEGGGTAEALVQSVIAGGGAGPFLHVRGRHARGDVAERLRAEGRSVVEVLAYDQPLLDPPGAATTALEAGGALVVPLLSPRAASHFGTLAGNARAPLHIVALSAAVAEAWPGDDVLVAEAPELDALAAAAAPLLVAGGAGG